MRLNIKFDILFGTAYKGIPIVVATSIALKNKYNLNIPYSFNRKEKKTHGEHGLLIGEKIKNKKIIILDDVITSGISINQTIKIIENEQSKIASILVLLDRKEKKIHNLKKIHLNIKKNNINTYNINSIITINDFISYLSTRKNLKKYAQQLIQYQTKYDI